MDCIRPYEWLSILFYEKLFEKKDPADGSGKPAKNSNSGPQYEKCAAHKVISDTESSWMQKEMDGLKEYK